MLCSAERGFSPTKTPSQRQWKDFAGKLWREVLDDNVLDGAAVIAFYSLLAVFPAALFLLSLLPSLRIPHLEQAIVDLMRQVLPAQSAELFEFTVRFVGSEGKKGLQLFGLLFALWSASSGVSAVMDQLNVVYDVKDRRPYWKAKGIAIVLMLVFIALAIGSLSVVVFGGTIQSWMASMIGWSGALRIFWASFRWIVIVAALLLGLAVAYRYGPDVNGRFRFISPGNVAAVLLIALASVGFRFYVSRFGNYSATYGNLAAMIILMLWMYMAGIAVLVGGEVNRILHPQECRQRDIY
jgi:membrane protein